MIYNGNFKKFLYNYHDNVNLYRRFCHVVENLALLYGDFGRNSYGSNNDEAMKQDGEALNAYHFIFSEEFNASLQDCLLLV